MAKASAVEAKTPLAPVPARDARVITTRYLDVERHGNDDYSVREVTARGPLEGPMRVVSVRTLAAHRSGNVVRDDYVRPWFVEYSGVNMYGPHFP